MKAKPFEALTQNPDKGSQCSVGESSSMLKLHRTNVN